MEKVMRKGFPAVKARAFWKKREWDAGYLLKSAVCFLGTAMVTANPVLPAGAALGAVLFALAWRKVQDEEV